MGLKESWWLTRMDYFQAMILFFSYLLDLDGFVHASGSFWSPNLAHWMGTLLSHCDLCSWTVQRALLGQMGWYSASGNFFLDLVKFCTMEFMSVNTFLVYTKFLLTKPPIGRREHWGWQQLTVEICLLVFKINSWLFRQKEFYILYFIKMICHMELSQDGLNFIYSIQ